MLAKYFCLWHFLTEFGTQSSLQSEKKIYIRSEYKQTVCKFRNFSITQILREINLGDSRSAKSAILTHLESLNFDLYECLHCKG